jgi:hypothetical protein
LVIVEGHFDLGDAERVRPLVDERACKSPLAVRRLYQTRIHNVDVFCGPITPAREETEGDAASDENDKHRASRRRKTVHRGM